MPRQRQVEPQPLEATSFQVLARPMPYPDWMRSVALRWWGLAVVVLAMIACGMPSDERKADGAGVAIDNPLNGFEARFLPGALVLHDRSLERVWHLEARVDGYGCPEALSPLRGEPPASA